jgi:hypothetical protein
MRFDIHARRFAPSLPLSLTNVMAGIDQARHLSVTGALLQNSAPVTNGQRAEIYRHGEVHECKIARDELYCSKFQDGLHRTLL